MTREELTSYALEESRKHKCIIAELATGYGKSKIAIDIANQVCDKVFKDHEIPAAILIVVAKTVHKQNWLNEIKKWGGINTDLIDIICYESLHKYKDKCYDCIILDEAQHLSDARKEVLKTIKVWYNIVILSATLPRITKEWLQKEYDSVILKATLQDAIDVNVLPDPTIYLMPLHFDSDVSECIYKNVGKGYPKVSCSWAERWKYLKKKNLEVHIYCTKSQYLSDLNSQINWYKGKALRGQQWAKTKWLKLCGDRLKWLAIKKNATMLFLLEYLKNYRTLTFCASIEQSETLGKNCIHSKNKISSEILEAFNNKKIKHITSCQMLNEGMNLTDCKVGIFANINASDIIVIQRIGRILRHKQPIVILPYYVNTREEELVKKHLEGYNESLIKIINGIKDIKLS